ncbi:hypothetical protein [Escherichia coli]|uniref:hypothetical protein n=1 Tax=Escherichia coli TaxID=562 RepID=UPI00388E14A4
MQRLSGNWTTDPTSGLMAMARQFRNVTAEQIMYAAQLQRSGDEAGIAGGERYRHERL